MIRQGRVSTYFGFPFLEKFGLNRYEHPRKPAVFFGCFYEKDFRDIMAHQNLAILTWRGNDILQHSVSDMQKFLAKPNIKHIAISNFISEELDKHGIEHTNLPITPTVPKRNPFLLGDCVYVYIPAWVEKSYQQTVNEVMEALPDIRFIISGTSRKYRPVGPVYKDCFIGLRPSVFDGLANTVLEMGLMGRRCIWNGNTPNAIKWETVEDITSAILEEQRVPSDINHVASIVYDFININNDWLDEKNYVI